MKRRYFAKLFARSIDDRNENLNKDVKKVNSPFLETTKLIVEVMNIFNVKSEIDKNLKKSNRLRFEVFLSFFLFAVKLLLFSLLGFLFR